MSWRAIQAGKSTDVTLQGTCNVEREEEHRAARRCRDTRIPQRGCNTIRWLACWRITARAWPLAIPLDSDNVIVVTPVFRPQNSRDVKASQHSCRQSANDQQPRLSPAFQSCRGWRTAATTRGMAELEHSESPPRKGRMQGSNPTQQRTPPVAAAWLAAPRI